MVTANHQATKGQHVSDMDASLKTYVEVDAVVTANHQGEISTSDQDNKCRPVSENLKQYSDCKFACIKCEKQLTVEKEVGEHMDTEGRPVHDGRETDNLNFSSQGEEDLKKSKLDSNFACKLCEKRSYDERNLKKHLQVKHKEKIKNSRNYDKKDLKFDIKCEKQQHEVDHGDGDSCDQCDFTATLKSSLKTHQQSKHQAHYLNNSETIGSSSPLAEDDVLIDTAASNVKDVDLSDIKLSNYEAVQVSVFDLAEEDVTEVLLGLLR